MISRLENVWLIPEQSKMTFMIWNGLQCAFLDLLRNRYPKLLEERFKVTPNDSEGLEPYDLLELVG
mgnify:CR=1 FL=1